MRTQKPAKSRGPAAFGLKKVTAWRHLHPWVAELLIFVAPVAPVALVALPEVLQ